MRILLTTLPMTGASQKLSDGTTVAGSIAFTATLFEPGEVIPPGYHPLPLATWRQDSFSRADGSLQVAAPPNVDLRGGLPIPAAVIPAGLLKDLPADALLNLAWDLKLGGAK